MDRAFAALRFCVSLLVAALAYGGFAPAATAAPGVALRWSSTTGTGTVGGNDISAVNGDVLELDVLVVIDALGFASADVDLEYDSAELFATSAVECPSPPNVASGTCSTNTFKAYNPIVPGVTIQNTGSASRLSAFDVERFSDFEFLPQELTLGRAQFTFTGSVGAEVVVAYAPGGGLVDGFLNPAVFPFATATINGGAFPDPVPPQLPPGGTTPVEYSNELDEQALMGGGEGPLDPGQALTTVPGGGVDLPRDGLDSAPGLESGSEPDFQVDALASGNDALLDELIANTAELVFSVVGDIGVEEVAAFSETTGGSFGVRYLHLDLNPDDASGAAGIEDLDGLELWGPPPAAGDDALYFSLLDDFVTATSVYALQGGASLPWISQPQIVSAVQSLGYTGSPDDVDVDALLVRNAGESGFVEDPDDVIVFSIRGVPGSGFDGSELIVLPGDGPPWFLVHGGHAWDTSFGLGSELDPIFGSSGVAGEDVDAIEVPEPGVVSGLVVGTLALAALRRRRRRRLGDAHR